MVFHFVLELVHLTGISDLLIPVPLVPRKRGQFSPDNEQPIIMKEMLSLAIIEWLRIMDSTSSIKSSG